MSPKDPQRQHTDGPSMVLTSSVYCYARAFASDVVAAIGVVAMLQDRTSYGAKD